MNGPAANATTCHIWSEFVAHDRLCTAEVLAPLAARKIQLVVAVTPEVVHTVAAVISACRDHHVGVAVWPMIDDAAGRWASARNADEFSAFAVELIRGLDASGALPDEVALDFEPPHPGEHGRGLVDLTRKWVAPYSSRRVTHRFHALIAELAAYGVPSWAAVPPMTVQPSLAAARGWQRLLGIPFAGLPLERVSVMAYTTLFQGYSRGTLDRADATGLLWHCARATHGAYGGRAGISLGTVGVGALGDERCYASPAELAEDVAIARAAGVKDLALFNLGGALDRPPLADWLDALVQTRPSPAAPRTTMRTRAVLSLSVAIGHIGRLL